VKQTTIDNIFYLSVYRSLFVQKAQKHSVTITYSGHWTGQWDHDGTEHCPKYIKKQQKTIASYH